MMPAWVLGVTNGSSGCSVLSLSPKEWVTVVSYSKGTCPLMRPDADCSDPQLQAPSAEWKNAFLLTSQKSLISLAWHNTNTLPHNHTAPIFFSIFCLQAFMACPIPIYPRSMTGSGPSLPLRSSPSQHSMHKMVMS